MSLINPRPQLISRPMKAPNDDRSIQSQYFRLPTMLSPKIDGFRCVHESGVGAVTSSMKPQPNPFVRELVSSLPPGLDGEIVDTDFRQTMSTLKRTWGKPDFKFCIFDYVSTSLRQPAWERYQELLQLDLPNWCMVLPQILVTKEEDAQSFIDLWTLDGYNGIPLDGVMRRDPNSPYKCNRSTLKEAYLLKDKPYEDAEAIVLGVYEQEENTNEAYTNHMGGTSRSSHASGKLGKRVLGGIICKVINGRYTGLEINLGSGQGWTDDWRARAYQNPTLIIGKTITFKYLDKGDYNLPRNASMKCVREPWDI